MCGHVGGGQKLTLAVYVDLSLLYLSRRSLLLGLALNDLSSLARQLSWEAAISASRELGL